MHFDRRRDFCLMSPRFAFASAIHSCLFLGTNLVTQRDYTAYLMLMMTVVGGMSPPIDS